MTATKTWGQVVAGDVLVDKHGAEWTVTEKPASIAGLVRIVAQREDGTRFTRSLPHGGTVQVIGAGEVLRDGMRTMRDTLGAAPIQTQRDGEAPMCPPEFTSPGTLLAHLHVLHGVRFDPEADELAMPELQAMHRKAHDERGDGFMPHRHTKEWTFR